ncbi:hypothetical protein KM043_004807 [Ampulex compressa]|nr:hypothetical protein KM043_004807 [Ampulex compressa]
MPARKRIRLDVKADVASDVKFEKRTRFARTPTTVSHRAHPLRYHEFKPFSADRSRHPCLPIDRNLPAANRPRKLAGHPREQIQSDECVGRAIRSHDTRIVRPPPKSPPVGGRFERIRGTKVRPGIIRGSRAHVVGSRAETSIRPPSSVPFGPILDERRALSFRADREIGLSLAREGRRSGGAAEQGEVALEESRDRGPADPKRGSQRRKEDATEASAPREEVRCPSVLLPVADREAARESGTLLLGRGKPAIPRGGRDNRNDGELSSGGRSRRRKTTDIPSMCDRADQDVRVPVEFLRLSEPIGPENWANPPEALLPILRPRFFDYGFARGDDGVGPPAAHAEHSITLEDFPGNAE